MKIQKHIVTKQDMEIDVSGVTLLSVDEYNENLDLIPLHDDLWWLRSSFSDHGHYAGCVHDDGVVDYYDVDNDGVGASPALILNPESSHLNPGDKFDMAGVTWTMLNGNLAQCDEIVGNCPFRREWRANDANVYEASDVRKWVENWAREAGIIHD